MRKMKKLVTGIALALTLSVGVPTLLPTTITAVEAAAIKISKSKASIINGKSFTLKLTGTKQKPVWLSDNYMVASVSTSGKVTGVSVGTAYISAYVNGKSYTCKVTVTAKSGDLQKPFDATKNNTYSTLYGKYKAQLVKTLTGDAALEFVNSTGTYIDSQSIPKGCHLFALEFKVKVIKDHYVTPLHGINVFQPGSLYNAKGTKQLEIYPSMDAPYGSGIKTLNSLSLYYGEEGTGWSIFIAPKSLKSFMYWRDDGNYNRVWTKYTIK